MRLNPGDILLDQIGHPIVTHNGDDVLPIFHEPSRRLFEDAREGSIPLATYAAVLARRSEGRVAYIYGDRELPDGITILSPEQIH